MNNGPHYPVSGGLNLPVDVGTPASVAAETHNRWDTIDSVNAQLKTWGMHNNVEPDLECPQITAKLLTTTDIKEYSTLFAGQLRWYNYAVRLLASVRAGLLQVTNQMKDIARARRRELRATNNALPKPEKMTVEDLNDAVESDPHYIDLKIQHQTIEQFRMQLDAWAEELDRNLQTVSRQIENRKAEGTAGLREQNMPAAANGRWNERRSG